MSRAARSTAVDVEVILVRVTRAAILVREDEASPDIWLPLSQVEFTEHTPGHATVTLPEWLATDRGLI